MQRHEQVGAHLKLLTLSRALRANHEAEARQVALLENDYVSQEAFRSRVTKSVLCVAVVAASPATRVTRDLEQTTGY